MPRKILLIASVSGLLIVALGAMGAHGLREQAHLPEKNIMVYETAVRYQSYHTLVLVALAFWISQFPSRLASYSAAFFITGIVFFSGSLYFLALRPLVGLGEDQMKWVGLLTPLGGVAFMTGWALLFGVAYKMKK